MKQITRKLIEEKGSVTIEAALILPFIIGIATLFFSMLSMMHGHAKEQIRLDAHVVEMSMQSYQLSHLGIIPSDKVQEADEFDFLDVFEEGIGEAFLSEVARSGKQTVVNRWARNKLGVDKDGDEKIEGIQHVERLSLFEKEGKGEVLLSRSYGFPMMGKKAGINLLYGGIVVLFEGEGSYSKSISADDDTSDEEDNIVYVTPSGTKYHTDPSCFHIKVHATGCYWKTVPAKNICERCGNGSSYNPNQWIFTTKNSRVVHVDRNCKAIKHEVRQMSITEAMRKGLTVCRSCQSKYE